MGMLFGDSPSPGLVGIASLAAQSEVLEAKRVVQYFEIDRAAAEPDQARHAVRLEHQPLPRLRIRLPLLLRPLHPRIHGTPRRADFEDKIYAKSDIAASSAANSKRIDGRKASPSAPPPTLTSPPSAASAAPAPSSKSSPKHADARLSITTKSDLVARDIPLLRDIAPHNPVSVNMTITTLDATLARLSNPAPPRPDLRLKAVRALAEAGIPVGVFPNPDHAAHHRSAKSSLDRLAKAARDHGAACFGGGVLFLMPCSRARLLPLSSNSTSRTSSAATANATNRTPT